MSIDANYQRSFRINGLVFNTNQTISSDVAPPWSVSLAAAKTGTLTTRTDNNTGILTMAGGHGILNGDRLDVYWADGSRRGMTVTNVTINAVSIDLGAGDNLPALSTAVTAQVPDEESLVLVGNNIQSIAAGCQPGGIIVFADVSNVELFAITLSTTVTSYVWNSADGGTNPLAGASVAKIFLSQPSSAIGATSFGAVQYS